MRFSTILTSSQAATLFDLVQEHRKAIIDRSSFGVLDGLLVALAQIDRGGGACVRGWPYTWPAGPDFTNIIDAAIIPASTYLAWPGVKALPGSSWWDLAGMLPELSVYDMGQAMVFRPLTIYRSRKPLAIIPLEAARLPVLQAASLVQSYPIPILPAA
jgi:hypothetical protein